MNTESKIIRRYRMKLRNHKAREIVGLVRGDLQYVISEKRSGETYTISENTYINE